MPDLNAAAELMRAEVEFIDRHIKSVWELADAPGFIKQQHQAHLLAAQALEALAWQAETGASVRKNPECASNRQVTWVWACEVFNEKPVIYYADTPFGALLAAMEGEKDES